MLRVGFLTSNAAIGTREQKIIEQQSFCEIIIFVQQNHVQKGQMFKFVSGQICHRKFQLAKKSHKIYHPIKYFFQSRLLTCKKEKKYINPKKFTGLTKNRQEIGFSCLFYFSCPAFLVLLLLTVKRSRRTTKSDLKCPEQGLEK